MKIDALKVSLPGAFSLMASGKMQNLTDIKRLHAAITADAHTDDISFVTALLDPSLSRSFRIPRGISLKGNFHADARAMPLISRLLRVEAASRATPASI